MPWNRPAHVAAPSEELRVNIDDRTATSTDPRSQSATALTLESMMERVTEISSLPAVALRVIEVAGRPDSDAADLKTAIEADPALCVRVLRCVNSASFGLRARVTDLDKTISFLGFNQIRDLAVTACVSDLFRSTQSIGTYLRADLWKHLVSTAVCARMIAARQRVSAHQDAFLCGLLHDIGIILFDQYFHSGFRRVMAGLGSEKTLSEAERTIVGWDHTELGEVIGRTWKLPTRVLHCIRYHHEPENYPGADAPLLYSVAIANFLCSLKNITSVGRNLVRPPTVALSAFGLDSTELKSLAEGLERELALHSQLLELHRG
jgi:HD-like signal output (HDOD) protein